MLEILHRHTHGERHTQSLQLPLAWSRLPSELAVHYPGTTIQVSTPGKTSNSQKAVPCLTGHSKVSPEDMDSDAPI